MGLREDCYPHMTDIVADSAAPAALLISLTLALSLSVTEDAESLPLGASLLLCICGVSD